MNGSPVWTGLDGTHYAYKVFDLTVNWNDVPGNYIFVKHDGANWHPLYIGETENFSVRLGPQHEKWSAALRHGMTHVHAHTGSEHRVTRRDEERNLIASYKPILND